MPVGHERINARESHPNDNIVFISVLEELPDSDQAKKILDALAAQFKPIMKTWGFGVNSLVEHEWNPTFAGRNWNAGEVVEIVLRRRDGSFAPYQFLLYVMCHELAHIREMNHSWAFQAVNKQLREELSKLRAKGYYGDGFWSTGRSLQYATSTAPLAPGDEPTFTCGGANKKPRRRRARRPQAGPSKPRGDPVKLGSTGRQSQAKAIAAKPGARVSRKGAFPEGGGHTLSEDPAQSSFKRRAQAKGAVEARAMAAEARIEAEKRAKAAAARAAPRSASDEKPRVKYEVEDDGVLVLSDSDEGEGEGDDGGWEDYSPAERAALAGAEVKLEKDEERFLKDDLRGWEAAVKQEEDAAQRAEAQRLLGDAGDGASNKGKRKGKATAQVGSSSPAPSSARKRRASPPQVKAGDDGGHDDAALDELDLTPQERAWIEGDKRAYDKGPDGDGEAADGIEHVGKKSRVAYMALPGTVGAKGGKGGKAKAATSKRRFQTTIDSSDDDDSSDDGAISEPADEAPRKSATAVVSKDTKQKRKHVPSSSDSEQSVKGAASTSHVALAATSARRPPMKFFAHGHPAQPALDFASSSANGKPASTAPSTGKKPVVLAGRKVKDKGKGKAVRPPSSSDDSDSDSDGSAPIKPTGKIKIKVKAKPESNPGKKPRKTRSDKGVKRGPRKPKVPPTVAARDDSDSDDSRGGNVDKLASIRREAETEDVELDWTDEEPAAVRREHSQEVKKRLSTVTSLKVKDKGKGRALQPRGSLGLDVDIDPDAAIDTDASSVCELPSSFFGSSSPNGKGFLAGSDTKRAGALALLDKQVAHNERVTAHRIAHKKARAEEEERKAEEAKRRIEARMEDVQREAATRARLGGDEEAEAEATGWGRNVFAGAVASVSGERDDQVAEENAERGGKWRCPECDIDNDAMLPVCEMCGLGSRRECVGWFDPA